MSRPKPRLPQLQDLRKFSREADTQVCIVSFTLYGGRGATVPWLILGETSIRNYPERQANKKHLHAYVNKGTDFEHDSAKLLVLPLVGLTFDSLPVYYHVVTLIGIVDPEIDAFRPDYCVPAPDYDPYKGAVKCKAKGCKGEDAHLILENYVPPIDEAVWSFARGREVEIRIGPTSAMDVDAVIKSEPEARKRWEEER